MISYNSFCIKTNFTMTILVHSLNRVNDYLLILHLYHQRK